MKGIMDHTPVQLLLEPGQPLLFGGEIWFHAGRATDKHRRLLFRNKEGLSRDWTDRDVLSLQQAGDLRFLTAFERERLEKVDGAAPPRTILDTCTAADKKVVDWKRTYVRAWEDAGRPSRTPAGLEPVIAATAREIRDRAPPSVRQLQRHIEIHVKTGGDPDAFVPQTENKGNRKRRLPCEMLDLVEQWVAKRYLIEPRPTLPVVLALVQTDWKEHNQALPVEDRLPQIKRSLVYELMRFTDRYTETFCHRGKREADHKFRMVEDGPVTERHNEAWEIDHTTVDLIVIDHATGLPVGRPFVTMAIDRHTRMIVGYHVGWDFPGIQPTLECLRCAISIKDEVLKKAPGLRNHWPPFGTPGLLIPDNAKHFKSKAFKEACRRLGIDVARPPVLKSWYKGKVERAFGTYVKGLCHLLPGTTFSNVYQRLKEKPPEKVAICTLAEFDAMLLRFIVDIYNTRRNRIMNTSPMLAYAASVAKFGQKLPPNPAELASKLSIPYYRKVQREGILFQGLWYRGPGIADLLVNKRLSRTVMVKVDPNDLSRIWFIHPATNEPVEWKIAKSQEESIRGIKERKLSTIISPTAPGRTVPDICRALMDGRLKPTAAVKGKRGLAQVRLSLEKVQSALPSSKGTLSILDAARQIGLKYPPVHFWVKRGLLQAISSVGAEEHGMRISADEWARFTGEYVTSGVLAAEMGQGSNTWVARHLAFLGVKPASGKEIDGGYANLFRRADVGHGVIKEIRRIQQGAPGTPQDKHRGSFERVATVASGIAEQWGVKFTRTHNLFVDRVGGRSVQVISGRRPDMTGVFVFHTRSQSLAALEAMSDPWVSLVPNEGSHFLLMPAAQAPWRGSTDQETRFASIRFDANGKPMALLEWAQPIPVATPAQAAPIAGAPDREKNYKLATAADIEKLWGVKLDRCRSLFTEIGGKRIVQVVLGKTEGASIRQMFTLRKAAYDRLAECPDAWIALVPKGHKGFALVPFGSLPWRPYSTITVQASVKIDAEGKPMGPEK